MAETQPPAATVQSPTRTHPPKPPLVLHVGVCGHRPDPNKRPDPNVDAIRRVASQVLSLIHNTVYGIAKTDADLFARAESDQTGPAPVTLRVLCSLASGADQWVTKEALNLGYELQVVLPFSRDEFAKDFAADLDSGKEYQCLLGNQSNSATLELDGTRAKGREADSYEAAGRAILQQSDLLIAVWDGENEKGRGGTGQMVREALQCGVPVIWIKWVPANDQWQLLGQPDWRLLERPEDKDGDAARLTRIISSILLPPDLSTKAAGQEKNSLRPTFYAERQPRWSLLRGFWRFFQNCLLLEKPNWPCRIGNFEAGTQKEWEEKELRKVPDAATRQIIQGINAKYLPHYAWANQLSMLCGDKYRSSFALMYLLGVMAVCFALCGVPALAHANEHYWPIIGELVLISAILLLAVLGWCRRWHERWMEYRTLAERLRLSRFMALCGGWRQQSAMPGHLAGYGDPVNTWVYWHYRAVERFVGLPDACMDDQRLKTIQFAFHEVLAQGQITYHQRNHRCLHYLDVFLHVTGYLSFFATFVCCGIHFLELLSGWEPLPHWLLVMLNALLPACGAALAGIRSQGEFHRIARRSEAMQEQLTELRRQLACVAAAEDALNSQEMRRIIERIAGLMLNETLDWRVVFQDRPLVLPA